MGRISVLEKYTVADISFQIILQLFLIVFMMSLFEFLIPIYKDIY